MAGFWGRRPSRASARMPGPGFPHETPAPNVGGTPANDRSSARPVAEALALDELRRSCRLSRASLAIATASHDDDDEDDDADDEKEDGDDDTQDAADEDGRSSLSHATLVGPRGPAGVDVRRRASLGRVDDVKTRRASVNGIVPLPGAADVDDEDVRA